MMFPRLLVILVSLVLLSGCETQFRDSRTINLNTGVGEDMKDIVIDPTGNDRTIKIVGMSDLPVSVYFYLEENYDQVNGSIPPNTEQVIASVDKVTDIKFSAKLPAGKMAYVTYWSHGKKATVQAEMSD